MTVIDRIRLKVRNLDYEMTGHAFEESAEDGLEVSDVESAILSGRIAAKFKSDPRGTRYRVEGFTRKGEEVCVVCRFLPSGRLRIITVFVKDGE